jgi:hypothetical protein
VITKITSDVVLAANAAAACDPGALFSGDMLKRVTRPIMSVKIKSGVAIAFQYISMLTVVQPIL